LPGPKKLKRPNLAISSFKKGQILKNEKRPYKGQISLKKMVKITKLKFRISDLFKTKYTIFVNIQKRPKKGQMAKSFYFWQTVSKKAKWQP